MEGKKVELVEMRDVLAPDANMLCIEVITQPWIYKIRFKQDAVSGILLFVIRFFIKWPVTMAADQNLK